MLQPTQIRAAVQLSATGNETVAVDACSQLTWLYQPDCYNEWQGTYPVGWLGMELGALTNGFVNI
jgi:hypothetical protein